MKYLGILVQIQGLGVVALLIAVFVTAVSSLWRVDPIAAIVVAIWLIIAILPLVVLLFPEKK